jgi:signal transduction histidine kinase
MDMRLTFGRREEAASQSPALAPSRTAPTMKLPALTGTSSAGEPALADDQRALAARLVVLMRGPLAHAGGVVDALLGGSAGRLPDAVGGHLAGVAEDTTRMRKAIEDLDALVRLEPHDPGDVRLMIAEDWLRRAVELHQPRADARGTTLELRPPEAGLLVRGVPDHLDGALHQLLDNALNATRAGGHVTVEAAADGQRMLVRVRDDGMGFDPSEADKLTGCFVRSRIADANAVPGLGVGLFLADRIARQHGGGVVLGGEPGAGATVWLELPQA